MVVVDDETAEHDYLEHNRAGWDSRADAHAASPDYLVEQLVADPTLLSGVVAFDRPRLGDLTGLDVIHLQCHIGTDTLSLARLGGRVTGTDLSPRSLWHARDLAARAGADIAYVESDTYAVPGAVDGRRYDLVYTGIGALCWLPSVERWAATVAALLRPGGRLFVRDAHPMLYALDIAPDSGTGMAGSGEAAPPRIDLGYSYFESGGAVIETSCETYVRTDGPLEESTSVSWNHGLGEIVTALLEAGFTITGLTEHDSAPWDALPGLMASDEQGEWRLTDRPERLAATFTLQATLGRP